MPDFNVRSDSVNVEQIMEQIRSRIREKRGVDYTEQQIRELATVKLERMLDPSGVRSDLLKQFHQAPAEPLHEFGPETLFESRSAPVRFLRRLFKPLLTLFLNPMLQMLHVQSTLNARQAEHDRLYYELIHNLVVETTRLGIEMKNLKMRVESLSSRVEFNERRARALESAVVYKPSPEDRVEPSGEAYAVPSPSEGAALNENTSLGSSGAPGAGGPSNVVGQGGPVSPGSQPGQGAPGPGQRSRRRRRRRGRRGGGPPASVVMGGQPPTGVPTSASSDAPAESGPAPDEPSNDDSGDDSEQ